MFPIEIRPVRHDGRLEQTMQRGGLSDGPVGPLGVRFFGSSDRGRFWRAELPNRPQPPNLLKL
jgi:hypothetical protein